MRVEWSQSLRHHHISHSNFIRKKVSPALEEFGPHGNHSAWLSGIYSIPVSIMWPGLPKIAPGTLFTSARIHVHTHTHTHTHTGNIITSLEYTPTLPHSPSLNLCLSPSHSTGLQSQCNSALGSPILALVTFWLFSHFWWDPWTRAGQHCSLPPALSKGHPAFHPASEHWASALLLSQPDTMLPTSIPSPED